jgi:hypothetical protein
MQTITDEPISVLATFADGQVKPWKFRCGSQLYDIARVHLVHSERKGRNKFFYFHVSNDTQAWKLRLNTETLQWRMMETYTP